VAALVSNIGAVIMLAGVILMALPVIRAAPWGYAPLFEAGLAIFLVGVLIALLGAIGWILGFAFAWSLTLYPLSGV
jgi:hypothetical protein